MQKEESNPLKQDIKKDKLRFYPYNIHWNYGMLPQTWEDPEKKNEELGGIAVYLQTYRNHILAWNMSMHGPAAPHVFDNSHSSHVCTLMHASRTALMYNKYAHLIHEQFMLP